MKDNFLLKKYQQEVFEELSDEDAGKLIKGIFKYVNTGDSELDGYLKLAFISIKRDIDVNEERYEKVCERNSKNGKLGGRPKKEKNPKNPVGFIETQENPKKPNYHNHIHNHNHYHNQIIEYLNKRIGSNFKPTTKATQEKINARLNEGYNLDDFIAVIDKKANEWQGTEMEKYLCPETLFGTKFEKYLNQKVTKTLKNISYEELEKIGNEYNRVYENDEETINGLF